MGSKNEKMVLLVTLIASGVVALASGTGMYFLQKNSGELATTNAALESRVAQAQSKINKLATLRAQREQAQVRLVVAESVLPSQEELESLVDNLADFARKSGVIITKASPGRQSAYRKAVGGVKRFDVAEFNLDLEGDYFQLVEFVNLLENYKRFIRVDSFNVKSGRTQEDPHDIALKFATFTYVDAPAPVKRALPATGGK